MLRALRSPAASSSRAGGAATTATVGAPRHPSKAWDADPSRAAVAFRGITTKSPLEAELEQQRAVEEMERAQREMREEAARIASGRGATSVSSSAPSHQPPPSSPPKPKPAPPMFGAPLGGSVARTPSAPATEKPQPKRTVVKAPTLGIAMHSDGRVGPAGNRNLMPEPPPENADTSQSHLKDMLADGSFERYGVGGLDAEFLTIFRRVFASRMVPPDMVKRLGMRHVKGMLLHGPPGTGKTLVARQLGKLLNAHPPKIVNGPEILQRFVGQSEENMRELFAPAEKEWKGKAEKSKLHVIIFDEIDAIMKARGSGGATASVVHDNVVNQLLTKLDGMQSLDNVLVVGITNRRDLLDPAVLRPGRLELQVEVGLPDRKGRTQIFNIHTARMRAEGLLATDVDIDTLAEVTGNYSGAEIKGLVGAAQSHALARYLKDSDDVGGDAPSASPSSDSSELNVNVTMDDFTRAMREVRPAMGADEEALASMRPLGVLCSCTTGSSEVSPHKRARDAIGPLLRAVARRGGRGGRDDPNAANDEGGATGGSSRGVRAREGPDHLAILVRRRRAEGRRRGPGGRPALPARSGVQGGRRGGVRGGRGARAANGFRRRGQVEPLAARRRRLGDAPRGRPGGRGSRGGVADGVGDGEVAPRAAAQAATPRKAARGGRHDVLAESARRVGAVVGVSRERRGAGAVAGGGGERAPRVRCVRGFESRRRRRGAHRSRRRARSRGEGGGFGRRGVERGRGGRSNDFARREPGPGAGNRWRGRRGG